MDLFQYTLLLKDIEGLTTKKDKQAMLTRLRGMHDYYSFKALTYLIKLYDSELNIGTQTSHVIKTTLANLLKDDNNNVADLTEFCDSEFTVTEYHFEQLLRSRYTTFQIAAYAANHIKVK